MAKRMASSPPSYAPAAPAALDAHSAIAVLDSPAPSSPPAAHDGSGPSESAEAPNRPGVLDGSSKIAPAVRKPRPVSAPGPVKRFAAHPPSADENGANRQAELFYLQKQIQLQTQMVFVLEDGSRIQGVIEWYDRHSIKLRGKSRVLVYKSAIKYLYKAGEVGSAPDA